MSNIDTHEVSKGNRHRDSGCRRRSSGDRDGRRNIVANRTREVLEHRGLPRKDEFSKLTNGWLEIVMLKGGKRRQDVSVRHVL